MRLIFFFLSFALGADEYVRYRIQNDISYIDAKSKEESYAKERCVLDLYYPEGQKDFKTIVWFHGGGLKAGKKEIPLKLKYKGFAVAGINYRLHPKVKSPKYVEDAAAAVAWVIKNIDKFGGDPSKVYVSGHSAGGYLSCMLAMDKKYLNKHGLKPDSVAAYAPLSGHTITHFTVRKEMGLSKLDIHIGEMAPIYHVRKETPKILLITGDREKEMLGRYEENAYFWRMMKVAGNKNINLIEIKGTDHGTMVKPALDRVIDFINEN